MIMNKDIYILSFILMTCFVFSFLTGCASTTENNQYRLTTDKRISVIPFFRSVQQQSGNNHITIDKFNDDINIEERLTNELIAQLKQNEFSNINTLPVISMMALNSLMLGKNEKPDVILYCRIVRYIERVGSKYAVSSPASVALEIKILDPISGTVISRYEFNETQQALSENVFNIKKFIVRKGRWVKAFDLATYGIEEFVRVVTN